MGGHYYYKAWACFREGRVYVKKTELIVITKRVCLRKRLRVSWSPANGPGGAIRRLARRRSQ